MELKLNLVKLYFQDYLWGYERIGVEKNRLETHHQGPKVYI